RPCSGPASVIDEETETRPQRRAKGSMPRPTLAELAVTIALEEARRGVFENANDNRGERIDEYQRTTSGALGEAWCAKFVYWCYGQAAGRLGVKNPLPPIFGAAQLELWAMRERKIVTSPALGDVL